MDETMDYRYYVVEFTRTKFEDQYVCIPDSWIQMRKVKRRGHQEFCVKYPVEKLSITKKRVENGEPCSDDWSIYVAEVIHGTNSYIQAKKYIKTLQNRVISKRINSALTKKGPLSATHKKQTNEIRTIKATKQSGALSKSLNDKELSLTSKTYLDKTTDKQKKYNEKLNNADSIECKDSPGIKMIYRSSVNHDTLDAHSNDSLDTVIIKSISNMDISDVMINMCDSFEKSYSLLDQMHDAFTKNCGIVEKMMALINNYHYIGSDDPIDITSKEAVTPIVEDAEVGKEIEKEREMLKEPQAEIQDIKRKQNERNEKKDDDNEDYPNRKRFRSCKVTSPSDYYGKDSKWTLRYRQHAPGLVELLKQTGVYVNADRFTNCKRFAKDQKQLAQLLLVEIFNESALSTCALTDAGAFDIDGTHIRPGLDENARTVLLKYIEEYANTKNWPKIDPQFILDVIRNKMQEIRFK